MPVKDHYKTLQVKPDASLQDIKKAYRRLAMQYHPDKTGNDRYAAAFFKEIYEAYAILSNPQKREAYHQERWYWKSTGKAYTTAEPLTPQYILRQCQQLEEYVSKLDVFRMNHQNLYHHIHQLLSGSNIELLHQFNEQNINRAIISTLLQAASPLHATLAEKTGKRLLLLAGEDFVAKEKIDVFLRQHKQHHLWNRYKIWIVLLLTILLCFFIWWVGA